MLTTLVKYAAKKSSGSTQNNRKALPKYIGVKKYSLELVKPGEIIITQRGNKWHPGDNVYQGKNFSLHAKEEGYVLFKKDTQHHYGVFQDDQPFEPRTIYPNHLIEITAEAKMFDCKIRHRFKPRSFVHVITPFSHPECFDMLPKNGKIDMKEYRPKPDAIKLMVSENLQLSPALSPFFDYKPLKFKLRPVK
eukprot:NODE_136_length_18060_cov_0.656645.p10 type:complete len:192 gc:universal NODE_136_length_18060_cov_0.656645:683-1258(+)